MRHSDIAAVQYGRSDRPPRSFIASNVIVRPWVLTTLFPVLCQLVPQYVSHLFYSRIIKKRILIMPSPRSKLFGHYGKAADSRLVSERHPIQDDSNSKRRSSTGRASGEDSIKRLEGECCQASHSCSRIL